MLNAGLALGLLGGVSQGGAPATSALTAFRMYQKNPTKARTQFAEREDIQRRIEAFKKNLSKVNTVEDLLKNRKVLEFVLSAFGLESEINNPGKLKAVLNSDPDDINSYANRLADTRFGEIAKFLDTPEFGLKNLKISDKQSAVIDKYLTSEFEKSLGAQNPAVRDALFFLRRIGTVESAYEILGDMPLRTIITETLNLPAEIAKQSVESQARLIERKFNLDNFKTTTAAQGTTSRTRLEILNDDLTAISSANRTIKAGQDAVTSLVTKLESLRKLYADHPNTIDPAGVNADEIPVQQAAIPDLLRQRGLVAAADLAVKDTRSALTQLESLYNKARSAGDADKLAEIQAQFVELADKILADDGYINGATYADPNSGLTQNLLRNGTGGALPAGTDATPAQISTTVATDGTKAISKSTDMAGFLADLQSFRDSVANADFATLKADLDAAKVSFDSAKTSFKAAEFQTEINVSSINNALNRVKFATEVDTASLALGLGSVNDSLARASKVQDVLAQIRTLAKNAQKDGADLAAINSSYSARLTELQDLIQNAGSVTNGASTVTFDNLLSDGTRTYNVLGGTVIQAEGGDLDNSILAGLPASITAGNAATLVTDIDDVYTDAVDVVVKDLTRDKRVIEFAANTVDPLGALDAKIRQIETELDALTDSAAAGGKNLLSPSALDLKVTLDSLGSVLTVDAQPDFKDSFASALESFSTTVLTSGSISDRLRVVNDALFAAGRAQTALKGETYALNIQKAIVSEEKSILEGDGGQPGEFLKPVKYTKEALKFIERYLIQKDMQSQGFSGMGGSFNANAALVGQIRSIIPSGGLLA